MSIWIIIEINVSTRDIRVLSHTWDALIARSMFIDHINDKLTDSRYTANYRSNSITYIYESNIGYLYSNKDLKYIIEVLEISNAKPENDNDNDNIAEIID